MTICDQFPSASCLAANAGQEQEKTQEQQRVRRARLRWTLQITAAGVVDGSATTSLKKAAVHEVLARSSQALPPTGGMASPKAARGEGPRPGAAAGLPSPLLLDEASDMIDFMSTFGADVIVFHPH